MGDDNSNLLGGLTQDHEMWNSKTRTKKCEYCYGTGFVLVDENDSEELLERCGKCMGEGTIELTPDEIREEIESKKEPKDL